MHEMHRATRVEECRSDRSHRRWRTLALISSG